MATYTHPPPAPASPFVRDDDRRVGHWLRDRVAAPDDNASRRDHALRAGARNNHDDMQRRYSQGEGRLGERAEQLRVRAKLVEYVRAAIERCPTHWTEWPMADEWEVLVPSSEAARMPVSEACCE